MKRLGSYFFTILMLFALLLPLNPATGLFQHTAITHIKTQIMSVIAERFDGYKPNLTYTLRSGYIEQPGLVSGMDFQITVRSKSWNECCSSAQLTFVSLDSGQVIRRLHVDLPARPYQDNSSFPRFGIDTFVLTLPDMPSGPYKAKVQIRDLYAWSEDTPYTSSLYFWVHEDGTPPEIVQHEPIQVEGALVSSRSLVLEESGELNAYLKVVDSRTGSKFEKPCLIAALDSGYFEVSCELDFGLSSSRPPGEYVFEVVYSDANAFYTSSDQVSHYFTSEVSDEYGAPIRPFKPTYIRAGQIRSMTTSNVAKPVLAPFAEFGEYDEFFYEHRLYPPGISCFTRSLACSWNNLPELEGVTYQVSVTVWYDKGRTRTPESQLSDPVSAIGGGCFPNCDHSEALIRSSLPETVTPSQATYLKSCSAAVLSLGGLEAGTPVTLSASANPSDVITTLMAASDSVEQPVPANADGEVPDALHVYLTNPHYGETLFWRELTVEDVCVLEPPLSEDQGEAETPEIEELPSGGGTDGTGGASVGGGGGGGGGGGAVAPVIATPVTPLTSNPIAAGQAMGAVDATGKTIEITPLLALDKKSIELSFGSAKLELSAASGASFSDQGKLSISPNAGLEIGASGYKPDSTVTGYLVPTANLIASMFRIASEEIVEIGTVTVLQDGSFVFNANIKAAPGSYIMQLTGTTSDGTETTIAIETLVAGDQSMKTWAKRLPGNTEAKLYAKNIIGAGKVTFRVNGKEIAWIRAVDATDPKLRVVTEGPMTGANYLVRTVKLQLGKNTLEVYIDGERTTRVAYSRG